MIAKVLAESVPRERYTYMEAILILNGAPVLVLIALVLFSQSGTAPVVLPKTSVIPEL